MNAPSSFDRAGLAKIGFTGFVRFTELSRLALPDAPGVYVVVRDADEPPEFGKLSLAGWFKGRDPTVAALVLALKWVDGARVLYIGKADSLTDRLCAYASIGRGNRAAHWGGRYVWQLADHDRLSVGWLELPAGTDAFETERDLLDAFKAAHGRLPFANLNSGRRRTPRL